MFFLSECSDLSSIIKYIKTILTIFQIVVPIIFIIWGTIDMLKGIISGDEKKIKETRTMLIKRLIYALLVFLVPWMVNLLITILGGSSDWLNCWKSIK